MDFFLISPELSGKGQENYGAPIIHQQRKSQFISFFRETLLPVRTMFRSTTKVKKKKILHFILCANRNTDVCVWTYTT